MTNSLVSFGDISLLVKGKQLGGNVIDAYGEILASEQMVVAAMHDAISGSIYYDTEFGKSFFVSNLGMPSVGGLKDGERNAFLDQQLNDARSFKYVHFPLYHTNHWMLLVSKTEDNNWFHYNSNLPRTGIEDKHLAQADLMVCVLFLHSREIYLVEEPKFSNFVTSKCLKKSMWKSYLRQMGTTMTELQHKTPEGH